MRRLMLHHFYRASIRKACVHMLSTGCDEKNDAKLTAVCIRSSEAIMNTVQTIDALNKAVALEKAATLQYKQHALLVRGVWRKVFADFFTTVHFFSTKW